MEVIRHYFVHQESWRRPDAAATDYTTATSKGDSLAKAPSAQPDYPRTLRVATSSFTSSATVAVTVTGTDIFGETITETITVPAAGTTTEGVKPFCKITSVSWEAPAGWTVGTFKVQSGTKLGLSLPVLAKNLVGRKEIAADDDAVPPNPADATVGTVNTTYMTYAPTTTLNAQNSVQLIATYSLEHILTP